MPMAPRQEMTWWSAGTKALTARAGRTGCGAARVQGLPSERVDTRCGPAPWHCRGGSRVAGRTYRHGIARAEGMDRLLLGSVAESVVRHAPCSVHVVRMPVVAVKHEASQSRHASG